MSLDEEFANEDSEVEVEETSDIEIYDIEHNEKNKSNIINDDDDIDSDIDDDENSLINDYKDEDDVSINSKEIMPDIQDYELSESDSDEDNEYYLQKFDTNIQSQIIENFHPELKNHNYNEIHNLSILNNINNVEDPLHKTLPFITKYEKTRVIGERAKQLNDGAKPLIEVDPSIIDGYLIALKEFEAKKIPFIIKRPLPNGGCEYWKLSDLEILT